MKLIKIEVLIDEHLVMMSSAFLEVNKKKFKYLC